MSRPMSSSASTGALIRAVDVRRRARALSAAWRNRGALVVWADLVIHGFRVGIARSVVRESAERRVCAESLNSEQKFPLTYGCSTLLY